MNGLVLTTSGAAEIEAAYQSGQTITIRHALIGDGGGQVLPSTPDEMAGMTSLYGEFGQEPFSDGMVDEGFISGDIVIDCKSYPGKTLRELGMVSASGTLIAYGRYPDTYLPDQTDSVIKEVILTLVLGLTHTQNVTLEVDPERAIITQEIGDRRYLQRKKNLSDVEDKGEAVENLGLKPTVDKANNAVQRDGDTMTGKLNLPQTSAFGVNTHNELGGNSIALGDSDTGLKQQGDGILDVYSNGGHAFRFANGRPESMNTLVVHGNTHSTGILLAGNGSAQVIADGNVYGSIWGGWLSNYLNNRTGVQDIRLGAVVWVGPSANGSNASLTAPDGHVLTAILDGDTSRWPMPDSPDAAYARPIQKLINGTWYNVGSV